MTETEIGCLFEPICLQAGFFYFLGRRYNEAKNFTRNNRFDCRL